MLLGPFLIPGSNPRRFKAQGAEHGVRRAGFGLRVQVRVDVGGRAEIAVAQPLLNLLERHMAGQQEAGA